MKKIIIGLMALTAITFSAKAVNLELALLIDGSGSISSTEFALQRTGYVQGLNAALPTNGSVAVGVWQFGSVVSQVFATTIIASAGDLAALVAAINGMAQAGGNTALGPAIQTAQNDLLGNSITSIRQLIDVSTDGFGNIGINQVTARDNALAAGIDQINGLLVGAGASGTFVGGVDSFAIAVDSFSDFAPAITSKLVRETGGSVPDSGTTLAMLGLAFTGIAGLRRKFGV